MGDFSLMVYNQDSKRQENNSDKNSINPRLIAQKLRWKNKFLNTTRLQVRPVPKMVQTHSHCFVSYVVLLETGSYFPNQTGYDLVITRPPQLPLCWNCLSILLYKSPSSSSSPYTTIRPTTVILFYAFAESQPSIIGSLR